MNLVGAVVRLLVSCELSVSKLTKPRGLGTSCHLLMALLLVFPTRSIAQAPDSVLRILYTGKLLGYYRIEAREQPTLSPVVTFLSDLKDERTQGDPTPLLLGMGDNFGPEFGAALQLNSPYPECALPPKPVRVPPAQELKIQYPASLYKTEGRLAYGTKATLERKAYCDNVLNFLIRAQYRAIVPGREDFLYGAWWLHSMGLLLQARNEKGAPAGEQRLSLLAANLRMTVKTKAQGVAVPRTKESSKLCPLFFDPDIIYSSEECTDKGVPVLLDWLNRLDRVLVQHDKEYPVWEQLRDKSIPRGNVGKASVETIQFRQKLLANQTSNFAAAIPVMRPSVEKSRDKEKPSAPKDPTEAAYESLEAQLISLAKVDNKLSTLNPSDGEFSTQSDKQKKAALGLQEKLQPICDLPDRRNRLLCDVGTALEQKHLDERDGKSPVLEVDNLTKERDAILWSIYDSENDIGFAEASINDTVGHQSAQVLIVAVVGPETMGAISSSNRDFCYKETVTQDSVVAPHDKGADKTKDAPAPKREPVNCDDTVGELDKIVDETFKVYAPLPPIQAILRAVDVVHPNQITYRILMAQMPQTEAEELASRLRANTLGSSAAIPSVDLILSEAQPDHVSPDATVNYRQTDIDGHWSLTPVLTPRPAYDPKSQILVRPDSEATITTHYDDGLRWVKNTTKDSSSYAKAKVNQGGDTALHLLMAAVEAQKPSTTFPSPDKLGAPLKAQDCESGNDVEQCKVALSHYLLEQMQVASHADVALLESRDIFFGKLPKGYAGYEEGCPSSNSAVPPTDPDPENKNCHLRVALDRVLWKGDYYERVMLSGSNLASLMKTAAEQNDQEQNLMPRDTTAQWLVTYGIVTKPSEVLTRRTIRSDEFSVPQSAFCTDADEDKKPSAGGNLLYCVNGQPLQADHAYSIVTTNHVAEDTVVYGALAGLPPDYREASDVFLVTKIGDTISADEKSLQNEDTTAKNIPANRDIIQDEISHQVRGLFQLDIGKIVVGYSFRQPQGGDSYVATNFQGATDSRAASPYSSEFDAEVKTRMQWRKNHYALGIQNDMTYDRSVLGNLSGNPVNAIYPLNNLIVGGFLQWNLTPQRAPQAQAGKARDLSLGKLSLVFAPYQYQRQINGNYLFFPFTATSKQQATLQTPAVNGFAQKVGFRWEAAAAKRFTPFDKGSYVEVGGQLVVQNNVLSAVTLSTSGLPTKTCPADSDVSISNCFKTAKYPVDASTVVTSSQETLHSGGLYWDVHLQKRLITLPDHTPGISLVVETRGNSFVNRGFGKALTTQTLYDVPLSFALTFPIFRNLSVAPTYSAFFYANQIQEQTLTVNSFAVNLRWYLDRDSAVPLKRQLLFKGPASADETKTARIK